MLAGAGARLADGDMRIYTPGNVSRFPVLDERAASTANADRRSNPT
jgi:hypothetical protein